MNKYVMLNFPGTGDIRDITHYVPLDDGIDDESYHYLFKPIIGKVMENFKPGDVVRQCGADSLSGDGLGCFNLSIKVHAECARYIRSFNVPLLLLGGGGYTIHNEQKLRTKCHSTSIMSISVRIILFTFALSNMEEIRSKLLENLSMQEIRSKLLENLSMLPHAPNVQFQERPS
ncbi:hypothetical protein DVH24_010206 [Malus domestica]|uniref:Histone deacetylase domain-containing protein n=1 Tax=Malus domestica TaxID=3750 RepID=A0A498JXF5_MALDO|nr:hypothetical protein DVH24_010206 [Malus domestica]